jgi:peptidoglycan/LPS O-acetylase OafA/YrhL
MPAERVHYFDWLRATAVLGVLVYHALMPFTDGWWINNDERSELLTTANIFFETFGLGLLFLLAGASVRFALDTRSPRQLVVERARRLLIPFAVGALTLTPLMLYLAALHEGSTTDSYLAFLAGFPAWVRAWALDIGASPRLFEVGFHLWFVGWLFVFSVMGLPIFAALRTRRGQALVERLARLARLRGASLLFAVPIAVPALLLFAVTPEERDWWAFAWYGVIFLVGYVLYADERFAVGVRRDLAPALVAGGLALGGMLLLDFRGWAAAHDEVPFVYDATYVLMLSLYGMTGWATTLVLLNVGMRASLMQRPLPAWAGRATLPVYVLHLPIVLGIQFVVVAWPLGLLAKAALIVGLAVAASVVAALGALRIPVLRSLLGTSARRAAQPAAIASPPVRSPA